MILGFVMGYVFLIIIRLISKKVDQIKDLRDQAIENARGIADELSYLVKQYRKQYRLAEESGMTEYAIGIKERSVVILEEFDKKYEKKRREMWSFAILSIVGFALGLISMVIWLNSLI